MRVVSLLPGATELLYALDVEPVGVSHECDYPPEATQLPTVVETTIDADESSADIDSQVQDAVQSGGVYEINRERLEALEPDVVVTQGMCDVCAVEDTQIRATIDELGLAVEIVTTDPHSLADVFDSLRRLGAVLDREATAETVIDELQERTKMIESNCSTATDDTPRVVILDWLDPVMVAGHWIPELVALCGGEYGLADPGARSRPREFEEIREYDPEILIAAPCGFEFSQTKANFSDLTSQQGWAELSAVETGQVFLMDGHNYVNRPGPRLVDTLEFLADVIHEPRHTTEDVIEQWSDNEPLRGQNTQ